jgi:7-cyano-7-deazaguanine reductase
MAHEASEHLTQLGSRVDLPSDPNTFTLETIPWKGHCTIARFTCPEFTSLCPVTGQPDFATLVIDYLPLNFLVESKSLKLWLGSFRNVGEFHEAVTSKIGHTLFTRLQPHWLRVAAFFYPRGGIPIDVFYEIGRLSADSWMDKPALDMHAYRGR